MPRPLGKCSVMSLIALGPMVSRDSFSDSVTLGERREVGIRRGKRWVFTIPSRIYVKLHALSMIEIGAHRVCSVSVQ